MEYAKPSLVEVALEDLLACACTCGLLAGRGGGGPDKIR